jgi:hypothetical protein
MQIKITAKCHISAKMTSIKRLTPSNFDEDARQLHLSCIAGCNMKWHNHFRKMRVSEKVKLLCVCI